MKYFVRIVDGNCLFIRDDFVDSYNEDGTATLSDGSVVPLNTIVETPCPPGFYWPRWDGNQWVEGGTAPEQPPIPEPTMDERNRADIDYIALMTGVAL